jgi:hypothetical protein
MNNAYFNSWQPPVKMTAIVIEPVPGEVKPLAYRYDHGIEEKYLQKVCNDMKRKFPGATHMNLYDRNTRRFIRQIRF